MTTPSESPVPLLEAASKALTGAESVKTIDCNAVAQSVFAACQQSAAAGQTPNWSLIESNVAAAIHPIAAVAPDTTPGIVQAQARGTAMYVCDLISELDENNALLGKYSN